MIDWLYRVFLHSSVALLLLALLAVIFHKLSASTRCWLWRAGYLKCLATMVVAATISVPLLPASPIVSEIATSVYTPVYSSEPEALPAVSAPVETSVSLPIPEKKKPVFSIERAILCFYLAGVIVALIRWCKALAKARRLWRAAQPILVPEAAALAEKLGLRRVPRIARHTDLSSPLYTFGGILLPETTMEGEVLALAHELAHARRKDLHWEVLGSLLQVALWWHPLVWWARRQERLAQEQAADALALQVCNVSSADYARTLLTVATGKRVSALAIGVLEKPSLLRLRIAALGRPTLPAAKARLQATCLALLALLALLPWRAVARQAPQTRKPRTANSIPAQRPEPRIHAGIVQTIYRQPIAGAKVTLLQKVAEGTEPSFRWEGEQQIRYRWIELDSMRTKPDGKFRWTRPYSADAVQVSAPGFATTRREFPVPTGWQITLKPPVRWEAIITDEKGRPFAGKAITSANGTSGQTDSKGHFVVNGAEEPGTIRDPLFRLTEPGWVLGRFTASSTDGVISHRMVAFPGYRLKGRVVDPEGQPVSGVTISLGAYDPTPGRVIQARTDSTGSFQSPLVPVGEYMLHTSGSHRWAATFTPRVLLTREEKPVRITVTPGVLVQGQVTNPITGKPWTGIQVESHYRWYRIKNGKRDFTNWGASGRLVNVDLNGRYQLRIPPDMDSRITVAGRYVSNIESEALKSTVSGREGETITCNFTPRHKERTEGQVVDEQGNPVAGATVVIPLRGWERKVGTTDQNGKFSVAEDRFYQAGKFILRARKDTGRGEWRGANLRTPIRLVLKANQAVTVRGRVLNDFSGRDVRISAGQPTGQSYRKIPIDRNGRFSVSIEPNVPGWVDIMISGFGNIRPMFQGAKSGATVDLGELNLPVADTTVTGRLLDEQGQPTRNMSLIISGEHARVKAVLSQDGTFKATGLVATDSWKASAVTKQGAYWLEWHLPIPPGKQEGIELRLTKHPSMRFGPNGPERLE
ncbi:MAG: M56 family metallopeptidase [Armatimonas sp.]